MHTTRSNLQQQNDFTTYNPQTALNPSSLLRLSQRKYEKEVQSLSWLIKSSKDGVSSFTAIGHEPTHGETARFYAPFCTSRC